VSEPEPAVTPPSTAAAKSRTRRAGQTLACGWCDAPITVRGTGRTPKWCSDTCRHRAWETTRAAAAGRAAVDVIDRVVEVEVDRITEVEVPTTVVQYVEVPTLPTSAQWATALTELAGELATGRVQDAHLAAIARAAVHVNNALTARLTATNTW
jgi:hypothetical protein